MIQLTDKKNCCGCAACQQCCPKHCITLIEDTEGFLYPHINTTTCIRCGLCEKVCPMINLRSEKKPIKAFVAYNKSDDIRIASSSGGIFTLLAEQTIEAGGVVFGAKFDEHWDVQHSYTEKIEDLSLFRGSKYVQSSIKNSYQKVKQFLTENRLVLFSGTPCQINGLKKYLQKDYRNLITIDFICHGVPSPGVWQIYLKQIALTLAKKSSKPIIKSINFRDKPEGWKKFHISFFFAPSRPNQEKPDLFSLPFHDNAYMNLFLNDIILRPSCYTCKSKGGRSGSDLTIADCWGIKLLAPEMDDDKGISLVMINTALGDKMMNGIEEIIKKQIDTNDAITSNKSWKQTASPHELRTLFFRKYQTKEDITGYTQYLLNPPIFIRVTRKICRICGIKQMPI